MTDAARLQVVVEVDTSKAESGLRALGQQVASFGQSFSAGLGIGAGLQAVEAGLGMLTGSFGALKGSVIDFNQQLDQSRAVFTRYFEGNQQVADQFLNTLKGFAATTPFEFKDLSQLAIRLQNANTSANDIIPTIKAIGNAASASGSLSQASLDRITLALTQMQMKGKVTGEEMLQLVEAGVPAWNLLAEATGKPIPVLQEMASKGQISADILIKAFRGAYENAGLMEGASKSLEGALSTIRDVGTQAFADIGRSVYDLATAGANQLATFLSSEQFQTWANAARVGVESVVGGIRALLDTLAPVGEVLTTAFGQLTSGDFTGAFATVGTALQTALGSAVESIQAFAAEMFGAGASLVSELAGGILEGASGVLQGAIDTVASTIAAFLIGQSPPPEGPLARIREGGANVIAAWGEGAASAADGAVKPAAQKIAGSLDELKTAGRGVEETIREIGRAIADIDADASSLKRQAQDIETAYQDQLAPLEEQLKTLTSVKDLQAERQRIEFSLEEAQLRQAEIAAQGDPVRRRELQDRLAAVKARQDEVKTARELEDAQRAAGGTRKEQLKDQLEAARLAREEADLREKLRTAKPEDRRGIEERLKELGVRKQIAAEEDRERAEKAARAQQDAQLRLAELNARKELAALTDQNALAEIQRRKDDLKTRQEAFGIQQQQARLERELLALPVRQEIERIRAEQEATLKPLQDQLQVLGRQKEDLSQQRQQWQGVKQEITAASQALKDQEAASKQAAKAAQDAAKNAPRAAVDKSFTPDAIAEQAISTAKESGARLAGQLRDGFVGWITANPLLTAGTLTGALFGAGHGAAIGGALGSVVPVIGSAVGAVLGAGIGAAIGGLAAGQLAGMLEAKLVEILGAPLMTVLGERFAAAREQLQRGDIPALIATIGSGLAAAIPVLAGKVAEWAQAFVGWAERATPLLLERLGTLVNGLISWIGENARPIGDKLYEWVKAFVGWLGTAWLDMASRLADLLGRVLSWIGENATKIAGKLVDWATEFVSWVGPKIPELLSELGALVVKVVEWIGTHAGELADGLGAWALEFVTWVGPKIGPLLAELGKLLVEVTRWTATVALPAIVEKLLAWGDAIIDWVGPRIGPLLQELGKLLLAVGTWFITDAIPAILAGALDLGGALLQGLWDGISQAWTWLVGKLGEFVGWVIDTVKKGLGISSPSTVFVAIGEDVVRGLWDGLKGFWDTTLKGWLEGFGATIVSAFANTAGGAATWLVDTGGKILAGLKDGWDQAWATGGRGVGSIRDWLAGFGGTVVSVIGGWVGQGSQFVASLLGVGGDMLMKIAEGFTGEGKIGEFKGWLKQKFVDLLPNWLREMLGIHSPSALMVPIGEALIDGIIAGMENKVPMLRRVLDGIRGLAGGGGGGGVGTVSVPQNALVQLARRMAEEYELDPGIFTRQITVENSAWDPTAVNPRSGAAGLGQFMPDTAREIASALRMSVGELMGNPANQLRGAAYYLDRMRDMFAGDMVRALAAYNWGPGHVQSWNGDLDSLPAETRRYLRDILGLARGGIVLPRPGGTPAILGEGGRPEAVIPLPSDWQAPPPSSWMAPRPSGPSGPVQTIRIIIERPGGREAEEIVVEGYELATRRGRLPVLGPAR